ncbi:acyltransferase family protein [Paenibacillus thermotolerans]|uniref:acyltransferase family protein n=1 Tax=Paenibacillus thermotolerans TaxID=3027807 RepID=UPI0023678F6F|nr:MULTISPECIES: acyltransferase [unclassified Paenibacillus]
MSRKIEYLDGLRGTAACIVVSAHIFQVFMPSVFEGRADIAHFAFETFASRTPLNLLFNGNFSVCLFFVLSGYVLSYRYFHTKRNAIIYSGAAKRYFRLAVPAFVSVLLAFAVMRLGLGYFDEVSGITRSSMIDPYDADPGALSMVREAFYHTFFTYGFQYNPVLWTMTYELFGSFMIFGFLLLLGKFRIRYLAYAALIWYFADSYYLGFVLGLLLSDLRNSGRMGALQRLNRPWVNVPLVLAGVYFGSYPYAGTEGTVYEVLALPVANVNLFVFYHIVGSFLLMIALLNSGSMQRLFGSRLFAYLGKISFSLYLVHFTIICSFSSFLLLQLRDVLSYGHNLLLTTLASVVIIFVTAHLMYRFVDAKTVETLSRWSGRRFGRERRRGQELELESRKVLNAE